MDKRRYCRYLGVIYFCTSASMLQCKLYLHETAEGAMAFLLAGFLPGPPCKKAQKTVKLTVMGQLNISWKIQNF